MTNQTWSPSKACADFVADLQYADIPAAVIDTMKRDTLDWIGCAVGGAADRSSQPIKAVADVLGGNSQATSIDCGRRNVVLAAMSTLTSAIFWKWTMLTVTASAIPLPRI